MLSNDGQQGVLAMGGLSYGEDLRAKVLDEALKGERPIREVAEQFELTTQLLRSWLKRHYDENPADTRRHFVERASENYTREKGDDDALEGETGSDEEMAKRDTRSRVDAKTRAKILERVAAGEESKQAIAEEYGLHPSTISWWLSHPKDGDPGTAAAKKPAGVEAAKQKHSEARQRFFDALDAGKTVAEARAIATTNGTRAKKWTLAWKRSKYLAKARATYAEKMKTDPVFNEQLRESMRAGKRRSREAAEAQQQLDLPEDTPASAKTLISSAAQSERTIPPSVAGQSMPPSQIVRYAPGQQQAEAMSEIFEEAVNERNALRGMVAILQREAEQKDKKLAAYRRLYGDIQP